VPRGDSVHRVGVIRDLGDPTRQLQAKSYRARSTAENRLRQGGDPLGELLGRAELGGPEPLARGRVERRRDLPPAGVDDDEPVAGPGGLAEAAGKGVEAADAAQRQAAAEPQRPRGGDAYAQAGKGAGAGADRDPLDRPPAAGRLGGALDLAQQGPGVLRPPLLGEAEQRLVQNLVAARRGDCGVARRGVEADDGQRLGTKKLNSPTRLPSTNQLTRWRPGMFELILLT
jgi:hypothetical protein